MSTPNPTALVTAPARWAKSRPVVFAIFMLLVIIGVIRFRNTIAGWFAKAAKWPVVGGLIGFLTGSGDDKGAPPAAAP